MHFCSRLKRDVSGMYIFVDESIHEPHQFMLLAYVISPSEPSAHLAELLNQHGMTEFHSLDRMAGNASAQALRQAYIDYLNFSGGCRWAIHLFPSESRQDVGEEMGVALQQIATSMVKGQLSEVVIDEGIASASELARLANQLGNHAVHSARSDVVHGIQLADLVAGLCGVRLREEVSGDPKMLRYGVESGFNPPINAPLGHELWAALRYSMCREEEPLGSEMPQLAEFRTESKGLFVSPRCDVHLRGSAAKVFGTVYLGCFH